jgi:hypothetical protein
MSGKDVLLVLWRFFIGAWRFLRFTFANMSKRVLIAAFGLLIGFVGPILAIERFAPTLSSNRWIWDVSTRQWIWDAIAGQADKDGKFGDIILACMPAAFLCFSDFAAHLLDDKFEYKNNRNMYNGLFLLELVGLIFAVFLVAGYVELQTAKPGEAPPWIGQFDNAWPLAKSVVVIALIFEVLLAFVESWREAKDRNWNV